MTVRTEHNMERISVSDEAELRPIQLGGAQSDYIVNLCELGFVGTVSDEARDEIRMLDERATLVLSTSDRFAFR